MVVVISIGASVVATVVEILSDSVVVLLEVLSLSDPIEKSVFGSTSTAGVVVSISDLLVITSTVDVTPESNCFAFSNLSSFTSALGI